MEVDSKHCYIFNATSCVIFCIKMMICLLIINEKLASTAPLQLQAANNTGDNNNNNNNKNINSNSNNNKNNTKNNNKLSGDLLIFDHADFNNSKSSISRPNSNNTKEAIPLKTRTDKVPEEKCLYVHPHGCPHYIRNTMILYKRGGGWILLAIVVCGCFIQIYVHIDAYKRRRKNSTLTEEVNSLVHQKYDSRFLAIPSS